MNTDSNRLISGALPGLLLLCVHAPLFSAQASAPVEERRPNQEAILQGQQAAGVAYRELQQAEKARAQAEQDTQRASADYVTAQKRADDLKRAADTAKKNLEVAKATEAQARKSYEAAVNSVDQRWQKPLSK